MTEIPLEVEQKLINLCSKAKENSYSPYSKFRVGAALLTKSGQIYMGCNVENASYGGAICAERTAFVKAISEGDRDVVAIAITTDQPSLIFPCGFCRQFMVEFNKELIVILVSSTVETKKYVLSELIPHSFGPQDLL